MEANETAVAAAIANGPAAMIALKAVKAMERNAGVTGRGQQHRYSSVARDRGVMRTHKGTPWMPLLLRVLVHPQVTVPLFMRSAAAVRHSTISPHIPPPTWVIVGVRRAATYQEPGDERVAACLAALDDAGMACGIIQLKHLAAKIGIDHAHLGRLVREKTGIGFVNWRRGLRLRPAVRRLVVRDDPIQNIAIECGFAGIEGPAHFSDVVHKVLGVSPTDFRAAAREARSRPLLSE